MTFSCYSRFLSPDDDMDVSKNRGTPKLSILIGFSIINHPFWGTPIFGNTHIKDDLYNLGLIRLVNWKIF